MRRAYFVYILGSVGGVLYVGVTSDLVARVSAHREGRGSVFTSRYNVTRLLHVERFTDVYDAIRREKQIKNWRREKKVALIDTTNPTWRDLAAHVDALDFRLG